MTVFEAFPNGIEAWSIAKVHYGTLTGNEQIGQAQTINVIVDEINSSEIRAGASATPLDSDTLLYAKPEELPSTNPAVLIAYYIVIDEAGRTYRIMDAAKGKNQDTGILEHIELTIRQTATTDKDSES